MRVNVTAQWLLAGNPGRFCCPVCKGPLAATAEVLCCALCGKAFAVVDGIPDLFVGDMEHDFAADPNRAWLEPGIVEARETYYRLCTRELRGMAFCMQEIGRRTSAGCDVLEVGMGTGHFTRWLAEVSAPGTTIYAFDFSWPIIEKAKANVRGLPGIALFRANARGPLPFPDGSLDIVFVRLAPLGPRGTPNVQAGYQLLKPGGWLFEAGWEEVRYETPPTEWAISHGYESAEHHVWQYHRMQTAQEHAARLVELQCLASLGLQPAQKALEQEPGVGGQPGPEASVDGGMDGSVWAMTHERLLIAQKPVK